eukprot:1765795-Pyramimonas_sp.AAC.1
MTHATDRRLKVLQGHLTEPPSRQDVLHACTSQPHSYDLAFSPPVLEALRQGRPVVALESTIITHGLRGWDRDATPAGMPYPQNLETAKEVEEVVRAAGAEPATIAVLDGVPHIGLTAAELQHLASLGHSV